MSKNILLRPRMSEKTYGLSEASNTYVFDIHSGVNKHSVADAVAVQYEVTVTNVRITNIPGKAKKAYRKRGRNVTGKRNDISKAYVTLKEGDSLPIFAAHDHDDEKGAK